MKNLRTHLKAWTPQRYSCACRNDEGTERKRKEREGMTRVCSRITSPLSSTVPFSCSLAEDSSISCSHVTTKERKKKPKRWRHKTLKKAVRLADSDFFLSLPLHDGCMFSLSLSLYCHRFAAQREGSEVEFPLHSFPSSHL